MYISYIVDRSQNVIMYMNSLCKAPKRICIHTYTHIWHGYVRSHTEMRDGSDDSGTSTHTHTHSYIYIYIYAQIA